MITSGTYISVEQIIGDAATELGDGEFRKYGRPKYVSAAQRALATLCKDVPHDVRHFAAQIPGNLIIKIPWGMTNKSLAVLYNGPNCNFNNVQDLFIKPNMFHEGNATYVANNVGQGVDILPGFLNWNFPNWWPQNWIYFAGEWNGHLYLSQSCAQFENLHITYSGLGMECWGDDFCIPEWAREAITDMVILRGARTLRTMTNDNIYREIIREKELAVSMSNPSGTWANALTYWGRMDQKQRNDVWTSTTYFGEPPY